MLGAYLYSVFLAETNNAWNSSFDVFIVSLAKGLCLEPRWKLPLYRTVVYENRFSLQLCFSKTSVCSTVGVSKSDSLNAQKELKNKLKDISGTAARFRPN